MFLQAQSSAVVIETEILSCDDWWGWSNLNEPYLIMMSMSHGTKLPTTVFCYCHPRRLPSPTLNDTHLCCWLFGAFDKRCLHCRDTTLLAASDTHEFAAPWRADQKTVRKTWVSIYACIIAKIKERSYSHLSACIQLECACNPCQRSMGVHIHSRPACMRLWPLSAGHASAYT